MKPFVHKNLAAGRWFEMSVAEQLGNIGSEYYRAMKAYEAGDMDRYDKASDLAMELCELTVDDSRWYGKPIFKEICRMKEQVAETLIDRRQPDSGLQNYFDGFALLARK